MDAMSYITELIEEGNSKIKSSENKDVIALLGLSGSGRTTVGLVSTSGIKDLSSNEAGPGIFVIEDGHGKISSHINPLNTNTILPELMIDQETKTVFYDSPGFDDTRNFSMEIVNTFLIKNVLDQAERVKLVFIVDFNNLRPTGPRRGLPDFLRHATNLIKDVNKFKDGIGMIVNKVDFILNSNNKPLKDDEIIEGIAEFINHVVAANDSQHTLTRPMIELLGTVRTKIGDRYPRMNLIRIPNRSGLLKDIRSMKNIKASTMTMINNNLKYVSSNPDDFGYTVSERAGTDINEIVAELIQLIESNIRNLLELVETSHVTGNNKPISSQKLDENYVYVLSNLSSILQNTEDSKKVTDSLEAIKQLLGTMDIGGPRTEILLLQKEIGYLELLHLASPERNAKSFFTSFISLLENVKYEIGASRIWCTFIITLKMALAMEDVIDEKSLEYVRLKTMIDDVIEDRQSAEYTGCDLKEFLKDISKGQMAALGFEAIKNTKINPARARMLSTILQSIGSKPDYSCYELNRLQVTGIYLKLSDVMALPGCLAGTGVIEIYAAKKLLINVDINRPGLSIVIVAGTVEIVGERKIILDGLPGLAHSNLKAMNGQDGISSSENGGSGEDGAPGLPGQNGGSFYQIADKLMNANNLYVSIDGGKGGAGQNGGDGGNGARGFKNDVATAYRLVQEYTFKRNSTYLAILEAPGKSGGDGGTGGNGGAAGLGGLAGDIHVRTQNSDSNIIFSRKNGDDGSPGVGGQGGHQGPQGQTCKQSITKRMPSFEEIKRSDVSCYDKSDPDLKRASNGLTGKSNDEPKPKDVVDYSYALKNFKRYVADIQSHFPAVKIPNWISNLSEKSGTRSRRDVDSIRASIVHPHDETPNEFPQLQIEHDAGYNSSRVSGVDAQLNIHPNLVLMDLIMRNLTKVEPLSGNARIVSEPLRQDEGLELVILTEEFERWLVNLCKPQEKSTFYANFNPMAMIQSLKQLIKENRRDDIYDILYNYAVETVPGLAIDDLKKKFQPLLL